MLPGTPASQLRKLNQPLENAPVQLVWAWVETVDAAKSANVASKLEKTNLQPARARDVTPARSDGKQSTRFAPHLGPHQSAVPTIKNWAAPARDVIRNLDSRLVNPDRHGHATFLRSGICCGKEKIAFRAVTEVCA